jgi:hypothetical protein
MGQLVKPGWGYSDRELERKARCSDRNLVREYHQGQQVYMPAQTGGVSEFLCKRGFGLRLTVMDSVPKSDGKLVEGGFPILDGHGPFLTDISESQVEQFDQGVIIGEEAPGLG